MATDHNSDAMSLFPVLLLQNSALQREPHSVLVFSKKRRAGEFNGSYSKNKSEGVSWVSLYLQKQGGVLWRFRLYLHSRIISEKLML